MQILKAILFILGAYAVSRIADGVLIGLIQDSNPAKYANPASLGLSTKVGAVSGWTLFTSLLLAPLTEEIICRQVILGRLQKYGTLIALLVSSGVFAILHYWAMPPVMLMAPFIFGVCLGVTYLSYGLPAAIGLHFLKNLQPWLSAKGFLRIFESELFLALFLAVSLAGVLVFIGSLYAIIRHSSRTVAIRARIRFRGQAGKNRGYRFKNYSRLRASHVGISPGTRAGMR